MSSKIWGLVVGAIIILGVGGILVFGSDDGDDGSNNSGESETQNNSESKNDLDAAANPLGLDVGSLSGSYRLTLKSSESGQESIAVFELDGKGNISSVITQAGQTSGFRLVDNVSYVQDPKTKAWSSFEAGAIGAPDINPGELAFSQADVNELNNTDIESLGEQECSSGRCRVYKSVDTETEESTIIKVDKTTNRISEVEFANTISGDISTITFEYIEVNIVAPEDATPYEIPNLGQ